MYRHDREDPWTMRVRIVATPDTCGGRPRIEGRRLTVEEVGGTVANGAEEENIFLSENPDLTRDDVDACLLYAAEHAGAYYGRAVVP